MNTSLESRLQQVELPTLGHFIEEGFLPTTIQAVHPAMTTLGRARTVSIPDFDAAAINTAILRLQPGEVLVVDMGDDDSHACVGAVTIAALQAAGAAGVVVNGHVTDLDELTAYPEAQPVPVFARGSAALTTKRKASSKAEHDVELQLGTATVRPGDWIIGDRNGVLAASDETLEAVIADALASDAAEPAILERMRAGEPLEQILWTGSH